MNRFTCLAFALALSSQACAPARDLDGPLSERAYALTGPRPSLACLNGSRGRLCIVRRPFGIVGVNFGEGDTVTVVSMARRVAVAQRDSSYLAIVDSLSRLYGTGNLCPPVEPRHMELREWQSGAEYVRIWKIGDDGMLWAHSLGTAQCAATATSTYPPIPPQ